jgi:DNA-directed RNA polymerase subunit beta'
MVNAGIRPEWMFLTAFRLFHQDFDRWCRLMVAAMLHQMSTILYRRVINRNNRLKKLKEINAPDVILRNEKRILQEAVDSLIDNSIRHGNASQSAVNQSQRRALKSLSDNLKGKRGLFRANFLVSVSTTQADQLLLLVQICAQSVWSAKIHGP